MQNSIGAGYDQNDQILNALRAGTDFRFPVTIRGLTVPLRPLSMAEEVRVINSVYETMSRNPLMKNDSFYESTLKAQETLALASTSAPGETDFKLTPATLAAWTGDEVQLLFKEYVAIRDRVNPDIETMSMEQLDTIIELLKKSPKEALDSLLTELSFTRLKAITSSLIQRD